MEKAQKMQGIKAKAAKSAFPYTIPILAGFLFLGIAYGVYMNSLGFSFVYPLIMSVTIFAGSMEFVAATMLLSRFNPVYAFITALMINARHLFYGISMLEKYNIKGFRKIYLIYGMCDESFSINCSVDAPEGVDKGWFMFFVTLFNQLYWVSGATIGGLLGNFITFNTKGLDFVMTALFIVIFVDRFMTRKVHLPALLGLGITALSLVVFGANNFIIPAMLVILLALTVFRKKLDLPEEMLKKGTDEK